MECVRCHQWVAVGVLCAVPQEAEATQTVACRQAHHPSNTPAVERGGDAADDCRRRSSSSSSSSGDGGRCETRGLYSKILEQVRQQQRRPQHLEPAPRPELYIPNPCNFVCGGWQCAWAPDVIADMRVAWLSDIYRSFLSCGAEAEGVSGSPSPETAAPPADGQQDSGAAALPTWRAVLRGCRAELNEQLSVEVGVSRRARLRPTAARSAKDAHGCGSLVVGACFGARDGDTASLSCRQGRWVAAAAQHLLRPESSRQLHDDSWCFRYEATNCSCGLTWRTVQHMYTFYS